MKTISNISLRAVIGTNGDLAIEASVTSGDTTSKSIAQRGSTIGKFEPLQYDTTALSLTTFSSSLVDKSREINDILAGQQWIQETLDGELDNLYRNRVITGDISISISSAFYKFQSRQVPENGHTPAPLVNIFDGGINSASVDRGIEYLVYVDNDDCYLDKLSAIHDFVQKIKKDVINKNIHKGYSHQGAFYSPFSYFEENLDYLANLIAGNNSSLRIGLDLSASDKYLEGSSSYQFQISQRHPSVVSPVELTSDYLKYIQAYGIGYVEDPFAEMDEGPWSALVESLPGVVIAGDDLFASNVDRIEKFNHLANAIVLKPNQARTISLFYQAVDKSKKAELHTVISQRTLESDDSLIAEIGNELGLGFSKFGGLSRLERVKKYNYYL